jgi:hypothetical protein
MDWRILIDCFRVMFGRSNINKITNLLQKPVWKLLRFGKSGFADTPKRGSHNSRIFQP